MLGNDTQLPPCPLGGPVAIKVKSHNGPGMGGTVRLGNSGCIEPGVLRCRVDALVDVQDVAGGRLAEMRTAGVDLNTPELTDMAKARLRQGHERRRCRELGRIAIDV